MPGDNYAVAPGQYRVYESEFDDRCGDLVDLLAAMRAGVGSKWNQPLDGPLFDVIYDHWGVIFPLLEASSPPTACYGK
jgi:hypothetical protein